MKVTDIKTFTVDCFRTNWVFVKVYTDEGVTGVGEATLEYKEKALIAGLLHDITKEADVAEHFELFAEGGVMPTELERVNAKLWHAMSGAEYIRLRLNITDTEIYDAVRYHTTARAGMSLLEKVIYIADFISADRVYDDVDIVRELAQKSLDETMLYTQRYSINELLQKGACIHPDSVACYNELLL